MEIEMDSTPTIKKLGQLKTESTGSHWPKYKYQSE